jgi:hypothetical protein
MYAFDGFWECTYSHAVKVITLWGATHPYAGFYPLINQWKMRWFLIEINFQNTNFGMVRKKVAGYQEAMRTIAERYSPSYFVIFARKQSCLAL